MILSFWKLETLHLHSEHLNDQKIQGEIVKNDVIIKNTFIFGQILNWSYYLV